MAVHTVGLPWLVRPLGAYSHTVGNPAACHHKAAKKTLNHAGSGQQTMQQTGGRMNGSHAPACFWPIFPCNVKPTSERVLWPRATPKCPHLNGLVPRSETFLRKKMSQPNSHCPCPLTRNNILSSTVWAEGVIAFSGINILLAV